MHSIVTLSHLINAIRYIDRYNISTANKNGRVTAMLAKDVDPDIALKLRNRYLADVKTGKAEKGLTPLLYLRK